MEKGEFHRTKHSGPVNTRKKKGKHCLYMGQRQSAKNYASHMKNLKQMFVKGANLLPGTFKENLQAKEAICNVVGQSVRFSGGVGVVVKGLIFI